MKTAIKVLNIVTIAVAAFSALLLIIIGIAFGVIGELADEMVMNGMAVQDAEMFELFGELFSGVYIFMGIYMVVPIVFAAIGLKKLKNAKNKSDLRVIGILTIIFSNVASGILMLCIPDSALRPTDDTATAETVDVNAAE